MLSLGVFLLFSCQNKKGNYKAIEKKSISMQQAHEAKKLMETHCYLCHSPTAQENEGRIAPPMVAIKSRYLMEHKTKEAFVEAITQFVANPTKDNAIMWEPVKRFGVMPKQVFPENSVNKIAEFMYDYQIEAPIWFNAHWQTHGDEDWVQPGKKLAAIEIKKSYEDIGLEYALSTKQVLGKNLMETIQKKGTLEALNFCNVQAIPLTDSMSVKYHSKIKRVSDKNRNSENKANEEELIYLEQFKNDLANKRESKPIVKEIDGKIQFYYPIPTNAMCLQCHGKQIKPEVQRQILKLYPHDLAVGYDENEVRGIWSITFDKQ